MPNSLPNNSVHITNSLLSTKQLERWSGEDKQYFSLTETSSHTCTPLTCSQMEYREVLPAAPQLGTSVPETDRLRDASNSTVLEDVTVPEAVAGTNISASNANSMAMDRTAALSRIDLAYRMRPKYLRYNLWSSGEEDDFNITIPPPCLTDWTEHAKLLPTVPEVEFNNIEAVKTIKDNPDLFKIITAIDANQFKNLLKTHPNRPFVESVCKGLQEGFWPWVDTQYHVFPSIVDESLGMPQKQEEVDFLRAQRAHKCSKGWFSGSFG
jgi:hypothetical protein